MSNRDPDASFERLDQLLRFGFWQPAKQLYTALPGVVKTFDAATRRARVQPAISHRMTDGTILARPELSNVPVVTPSGGGFHLHIPLRAGDPVLLVFSMRSIKEWKRKLAVTAPGSDAIMQLSDAIAIPGFGSAGEMTLGAADGLTLQSEDGETFLSVRDGEISLRAGGQSLVIDGTLITDLKDAIAKRHEH